MKFLLQSCSTGESIADIVVDKFPFVIGRSSSTDHPLQLVVISRQHCRFTLRGEAAVVEDAGSSNGTYLNGVRLNGPTAMRHGDELRLGLVAFRIDMRGASPSGVFKPADVGAVNDASTVMVPPPPRGTNALQSGKTMLHASNSQIRGFLT